jgi:TonB-dependent SusC/RagA subfamily outer membrane receptor
MTTGDSLGRYGFYDLDFTDTSSVMVQATKEKGGKNLDVTVDPYTPPMVRIVKSPFNPIEFDARALELFLKKANEAIELEKKLKLDKNQMLEEVVVRAKKEKPVDNRKIYGRASNTVEVTEQNCVGFQNVFQLLQGKVPGVQVVGNSVIIRGASSFQSSNAPLYVLDGITSDDVGLIQNIPPCDVETIDVLKGAEASIYGSRGANGVISVLTRRGGSNRDYSKDIIPGVITTKKLGYSVAREFYAPRYDVQKQEHVRPDFRSTLQWSPNVKTDANGKATLTFWNTDGTGNMLIIAEGVGVNGRVGVGKHEYTVK